MNVRKHVIINNPTVLNKQNEKHARCATIGAFDGVHLGHQSVINRVCHIAREKNLISTVICFYPLPQEYFSPQRSFPRITPFRDQVKAFQKTGVDQIVYLNFNEKLSQLTAIQFIKHVLIDVLNINHLVVGDDFRFGKGRQGDFNLLVAQSSLLGYKVERSQSYCLDGVRISSTLIRHLLSEHRFYEASRYLGRYYGISGRIHHGDKKGRELGFPTINVPLAKKMVLRGVYVVKVLFRSGHFSYGVANLGTRPTVNGIKRLLEVHFFENQANLYGKHVTILFLKYLREEKKFDSLAIMQAYMQKDTQKAREWIESNLEE